MPTHPITVTAADESMGGIRLCGAQSAQWTQFFLVALLPPLAVNLPVNAVSLAPMISALFPFISVEPINSAIEQTIDHFRPEIHASTKPIKT